MEPTLLLSQFAELFNAVLKFFELSRSRHTEPTADYDEALKSLNTAVIETQIYLGELGRNPQRIFETERLLARLWSDAGFQLDRWEPDMAKRCRLKATHWAEPETWTDEQIRQSGIGIDRIAEFSNQLQNERQ